MDRHHSFTSRTLTAGRVALAGIALPIAVFLLGGCMGDDDDDAPADTAKESASVVLQGAAAVFAHSSPSVPLVKTAAGSTGGLLIDGGYVLTAASLVQATGAAQVVFAEGQPIEAQVAAVDPLTGLAALGPIKTDARVAAVPDKTATPVGSELYLVGYSSGVQAASISRTLLAGTAKWEAAGLTLLRMDTPGVPMSAPTVAFSSSGQAVAIQSLAAGKEAAFALPANEVVARMKALLAKSDLSARRTLLGAERKPVLPLEFDGVVTQRLVGFEAKGGSPVSLVLSGDAAATLTVSASTGSALVEGAVKAGEKAEFTFVPKVTGPAFALIRLDEPSAAKLQLSSDADLGVFTDPDDLRPLKPGTPYTGASDFPGDIDTFVLELAAGQTATITATAGAIDPIIEVLNAEAKLSLADDDTAGGPFGGDAVVQFKAPVAGRYLVRVSDATLEHSGGYVVAVQGAKASTDTAGLAAQVRTTIQALAADAEGRAALLAVLAESTAPFAPHLPAAHGAAWRGTVASGKPATSLATTDTTEGEGSTRTVTDPDGRFALRGTIAAVGSASATLRVVNAKGTEVTGGGLTVIATCVPGTTCLASAQLEISDAAGNGPWTVTLEPGAGEIAGWQVEVHRAPADLDRATLPAQ